MCGSFCAFRCWKALFSDGHHITNAALALFGLIFGRSAETTRWILKLTPPPGARSAAFFRALPYLRAERWDGNQRDSSDPQCVRCRERSRWTQIHGATIRARRLGERFVRPCTFAPITISSTVEYRLRGASPDHRAGTSLALPRLGESCIS
jgi:hypothetical protein